MGDYLIPDYSLSEFRKLSGRQIKQLKSCVITLDGEYLFTFINPTTDYLKQVSFNTSMLGNTLGLKTLEEILNPVEEQCQSTVTDVPMTDAGEDSSKEIPFNIDPSEDALIATVASET